MRAIRVDLVYFAGCPNATKARRNLRAATEGLSKQVQLSEWDLLADTTPEHFRQHGSPTVLVNGKDVTGEGLEAVAMACRADGAPSVEIIAKALA